MHHFAVPQHQRHSTRDLALRLRDMLGRLGLEVFVKTSGRTGLHLYLPIVRKFDYDAVRSIAAANAQIGIQPHDFAGGTHFR